MPELMGKFATALFSLSARRLRFQCGNTRRADFLQTIVVKGGDGVNRQGASNAESACKYDKAEAIDLARDRTDLEYPPLLQLLAKPRQEGNSPLLPCRRMRHFEMRFLPGDGGRTPAH
jgi:hypothetical protein